MALLANCWRSARTRWRSSRADQRAEPAAACRHLRGAAAWPRRPPSARLSAKRVWARVPTAARVPTVSGAAGRSWVRASARSARWRQAAARGWGVVVQRREDRRRCTFVYFVCT